MFTGSTLFSTSYVVSQLATYFPPGSSSSARQEMAFADALREIHQRAVYADIDYEDDEDTCMVMSDYSPFIASNFHVLISSTVYLVHQVSPHEAMIREDMVSCIFLKILTLMLT